MEFGAWSYNIITYYAALALILLITFFESPDDLMRKLSGMSDPGLLDSKRWRIESKD